MRNKNIIRSIPVIIYQATDVCTTFYTLVAFIVAFIGLKDKVLTKLKLTSTESDDLSRSVSNHNLM